MVVSEALALSSIFMGGLVMGLKVKTSFIGLRKYKF